MEFALIKFIEPLLLPPGGPLLLILIGLLILRWRPRTGLALSGGGVVALIALSLAPVASWLIMPLQRDHQPQPPQAYRNDGAGAIVILSADFVLAREYGGETVGPYSLERIRYGAHLQRATGLPVLVSGGVVHDQGRALAVLFSEALEQDFNIPVRWREAQSRTTEENARYSAEMLRANGITRVLLVTHAAHMPRSLAAFTRHGIDAVPAPTRYYDPLGWAVDPYDFLPSSSALHASNLALHEWLGRLWYALRY